jgi:hypothetical protein
LPGISRRPFEVPQHDPLVGFAQSVIAEAAEDICNVLVPGVGFRMVRNHHSFSAGDEFPDLLQSSVCSFLPFLSITILMLP